MLKSKRLGVTLIRQHHILTLFATGVTCDFCMAENFRGRRYKCLQCYDFDLCEACSTLSRTDAKHSLEHPMQCILTPKDCGLYVKIHFAKLANNIIINIATFQCV